MKMKKKRTQGFTLLELLISFGIVVILVLGAAQLTLHSLYVKRVSDCSLESAELASGKLEYLKSLPFECQELDPGTYMERIRSQKRNDMFLREWAVFDMTSKTKRIEVTCYSESHVHRRVRFILLFSKKLGF
jgi:hypothetical protein